MAAVPLLPSQHWGRAASAARLFGILAVVALAAVQGTPAGVLAVILLALSAGLCVVASRHGVSGIVLGLAEALVASVVIGTQLGEHPYTLLYLIVPPFVAGLTAGLAGATGAGLIEVAVIAVLTAPTLSMTALTDRMQVTAPWFLTSFGTGLLGAWLRQLEQEPPRDHDAYHSARRLLAELRTVARSLSAGLDAVGIAQQILVEVHEALADEAAVVLVRTEGGVLVPLTLDEGDRLSDVGSDDPVVMECWTTEAPAQEVVGGRNDRMTRVALPLQAGLRMVGVVVAECPASLSSSALQELRGRLSEHSFRLDTALVFDEVRTLATADERRRLAREIHDGIAQEVASIGYTVDEMIADSVSAEQSETLRGLRYELTRIVSELRLSIFDLRSEISHHAGFGSALTDYVRQVGTRSGMTVHLSLNETPQRLRVEVETEILRLAQEAITNARRHSGASNLWVTFAADPPHAVLTIADDGHGLGPPRSDSYGLRIMRERAERIGASLDIRARHGGGTEVSLTLAPDTTRAAGRAAASLDSSKQSSGTVQGKGTTDVYVGSPHR
ncbi:MAG: sensor histidine kinase [Nocardioidaceae bacterium]